MDDTPAPLRESAVTSLADTEGGRVMVRLLGGRWLDYALLALGCYAIAATPYVALDDLTGWARPVNAAVSLTVGAALCALAYAERGRVRSLLSHALPLVESLPLWSLILLGFVLRVSWNLLFHAQPGSDAAVYVHLARQLAAGGPFEVAGTRAYWPVGFPAYLSVWFRVFGDGRTVLLASSLTLYVIAGLGVHRVTVRLANRGAGKLAALLFAVWPNLVAMTATPEKEMLITALLPWASYLVVDALQTDRRAWKPIAGGLALGGCCLVQPSFVLLPLLAVPLIFAFGPISRRKLVAAILVLGGSAAAIAPWTARNYAVLHRFVLVSTNGGDVLYRANNPLATGGYTPRGKVDLSGMDELTRDSESRRLALEWIRSHPIAFAELAVLKQVRFLGDDSTGIYNTFKVGRASHDPLLYLVLKAASNAWWIGAWLALVSLLASSVRRPVVLSPAARLPIWLWLYLFALHSVFESASKYHVPVLWALCTIIGTYIASIRADPREGDPT